MYGGAGTAKVVLEGGRELELHWVRWKLPATRRRTFSNGSLLVNTSAPVRISTSLASIGLETGTIRFDGPTGRIGAYEARRHQDDQRATRTSNSRAYWQVVLTPDGGLEQARPLQIARDDAWDRRLAGQMPSTRTPTSPTWLRASMPSSALRPPAALIEGIRRDRSRAGGVGTLRRIATLRPGHGTGVRPGVDEKDSRPSYSQGFEPLTLNTLGASWGMLAEQFGVIDARRLSAGCRAEINSIPIPQPTPAPLHGGRRALAGPSAAPPCRFPWPAPGSRCAAARIALTGRTRRSSRCCLPICGGSSTSSTE